MSVFLTDKSLGTKYGSKISPTQSKADQLLSSIHSLSILPIKSHHFFISYSIEYFWAKNLIEFQIYKLFPNSKVYSYSLETFDQWKYAASIIPKGIDQIFLNANHDHVYVRETAAEFKDFTVNLQEYGYRYIGQITHWSEFICSSRLTQQSVTYFERERKRKKERYRSFNKKSVSAIGTSIISKKLFLEWWQHDFTGGEKIIRPDNPFGPSVKFPHCHEVLPLTELFRHLDGYGHIGINAPLAGPLRACCRIINEVVVHNDWSYGRVSHCNQKIDLPMLPVRGRRNSIQAYLYLLKLASALEINMVNLNKLLSSYTKNSKLVMFLLILLVFDKYYFKKVLKAMLMHFSKFKKIIVLLISFFK